MVKRIIPLLFTYSLINAQIALPTFQAVQNSQITVAVSGLQTFSYTGSQQTFTVPSGVTSISVDMTGGSGGYYQSNTTSYGKGGRVQATLTVISGSTLFIYVGGSGSGVTGGYNGGGTTTPTGSNWRGSGGGGASDIRSGGTALTDRIIVAGGGGGGNGSNGAAGHGGGLTGGDASGRYGGKGGTQSAGGDGYGNQVYGPDGSLGVGGNGTTYAAGSGGGGYYGGSPGGNNGGGGGSSYVTDSGSSNITHTQGYNTGNGEIIISW